MLQVGLNHDRLGSPLPAGAGEIGFHDLLDVQAAKLLSSATMEIKHDHRVGVVFGKRPQPVGRPGAAPWIALRVPPNGVGNVADSEGLLSLAQDGRHRGFHVHIRDEHVQVLHQACEGFPFALPG